MKAEFHRLLIAFLSFITLFLGCSKNDPISSQQEHVEAVRMQILNGEEIIYDFISAEYNENDVYSNDTIFIAIGQTSLLKTKFIDESGNEINPADEANAMFEAQFGNTSIANISWPSGKEGEYEFYFIGLNPGISTITFFIMHEGHPDFRTKVNHIVVR